jgi:hypothetical protein
MRTGDRERNGVTRIDEEYSQCAKALERLKDAARSRDGASFRRLCHAVRGACLAIGASRMSIAAGALETMCEDGRGEAAMERLNRLAEISIDTRAAIDARLRQVV